MLQKAYLQLRLFVLFQAPKRFAKCLHKRQPPHLLPSCKEFGASSHSFLYFEGVPNYFWLSWLQTSREQAKRLKHPALLSWDLKDEMPEVYLPFYTFKKQTSIACKGTQQGQYSRILRSKSLAVWNFLTGATLSFPWAERCSQEKHSSFWGQTMS